jgi:hypothetical protein
LSIGNRLWYGITSISQGEGGNRIEEGFREGAKAKAELLILSMGKFYASGTSPQTANIGY